MWLVTVLAGAASIAGDVLPTLLLEPLLLMLLVRTLPTPNQPLPEDAVSFVVGARVAAPLAEAVPPVPFLNVPAPLLLFMLVLLLLKLLLLWLLPCSPESSDEAGLFLWLPLRLVLVLLLLLDDAEDEAIARWVR
jgi:hypothetical protein